MDASGSWEIHAARVLVPWTGVTRGIRLTLAEKVETAGLRVIDWSGALVDQPYVVQVWALANALFVWMGSAAAKPSLRFVLRA